MDIEKLTLVELKAFAYDLINQIEQSGRTLNEINKKIEDKKREVFIAPSNPA